MTAPSFPCIICGTSLDSVLPPLAEQPPGQAVAYVGTPKPQPSGGVMCSTIGNYGSTVYDPNTGRDIREALAFNICDQCIVRAAMAGRLWRRVRIPRPDDWQYTPWERPGEPPSAAEPVTGQATTPDAASRAEGGQ